jgi:alpha-L-arabinofuranosidase
VQCLFAEHLGDGTAHSTISGQNTRFFYSATVSSGDKVLHLKLVNASSAEQPLSAHLTGVSGALRVRMTTLHAASYQATNSMADPDAIHPEDSSVSVTNGVWKHTVPALTIEVVDTPLH